ncbi:TonB-dependent receptor [Ferruginibacter lapsinanis]|uniref:TonB-dependent receptor plug domain-containing protein n=1 Tax=Ferruginibacter lapsinanis TaxID=563172 RepID=UPI001E2EEC54|nr:TonB-dependent receptor [Ferruginibacter lapsinanis]UEG50464.1 TonB-dependent receptor [Ferruginibacter lapsinanis]
MQKIIVLLLAVTISYNTANAQAIDSTFQKDLNEIILQSTRTSRTIKNTPTRVETIDGEELDEKNNMRPANVSMLLHESTGLQVQQTSATSGNPSIRVQGLDGRYTQLLKDGYPNFGNFASGLSIMEIPPLDLKQVEIIKGPASTLYGGGAIAGVVNFISKMPKEKFEGDFILNQSHIGQSNLGGYISEKNKKFGYSILGSVNIQKAYDVDNDEFSEIPKSNNFTIHPGIFYYPNASLTLMLSNSYTKGTNIGGDMHAIKGTPDPTHTYFEKNSTIRNTSTFELDKKFKNNTSIKLKQSLSVFDRHISIPDYNFSGISTNSFTDLSVVFSTQKHTMIGGLNIIFDKFKQENTNTQNTRSFTAGTYFQDTWDISDKVKIESGIRIDNVSYKNINYDKNQTFVLPRVSSLFKITDKISSRIGGGLGYKIPTVFTEQTEAMQYQHVLPLNNVDAEKSIGGTADINYRTNIYEDLSFSLNQLFFYTSINNPLILQSDNFGTYSFSNAAKHTISKGFETNLKFVFKDDLKLFVGYTYTNAKATYLPANQFLPLLPKHKLNLTMMYEKEDNFKLGLEGYFTDHQYLYNGYKTPSFWEFGFMAQKTFSKVSIFINFENFTDQRQSKYKSVANPPHDNPTFDDIWNHTEGFVVNGGIKIKL